MKNKLIFGAAIAGFLVGLIAAYIFAMKKAPLPPAFAPVENPYPNGIYSVGIIESVQASGSNISIFPEVAGVVKNVLVAEGQEINKGTVLLRLDDSVPRAQEDSSRASFINAKDNLSKLEAAFALDPRSVSRDSLDTARNTVAAARANSLPVIAVATGHYSYDELLEHRPEVCATTLADLRAATRVAQ